MKFWAIDPYQLVPSLTNVRMSIFPAVAVIVGVVPPAHLTVDQVAAPLPVVAACLSSRTNDFPAVAVGIVNAQVLDAVRVAVKNEYASIA